MASRSASQIGAPTPIGRAGVDRPLQPAPAEHPQFDPAAVLGAFLALARVRIHEVQVSHHHANPLESEGIEHRESLLRRG